MLLITKNAKVIIAIIFITKSETIINLVGICSGGSLKRYISNPRTVKSNTVRKKGKKNIFLVYLSWQCKTLRFYSYFFFISWNKKTEDVQGLKEAFLYLILQ